MTTYETIRTALNHIRRTIHRTFRHIAFERATATLTLSFPPFVKLEIKAETAAKPQRRRRRRQHRLA